MAKVKDVLGKRPPFQIKEFVGDPLDPTKLWANYDAETDSVVIYLNGGPQPSVSVYTNDDLYIMVDPNDRRLIGFHVENWEKSFVPAHAEIHAAWTPIKQTNGTDSQPWETLMRMLALWTIFVLRAENSVPPAMQPV